MYLQSLNPNVKFVTWKTVYFKEHPKRILIIFKMVKKIANSFSWVQILTELVVTCSFERWIQIAPSTKWSFPKICLNKIATSTICLKFQRRFYRCNSASPCVLAFWALRIIVDLVFWYLNVSRVNFKKASINFTFVWSVV